MGDEGASRPVVYSSYYKANGATNLGYRASQIERKGKAEMVTRPQVMLTNKGRKIMTDASL